MVGNLELTEAADSFTFIGDAGAPTPSDDGTHTGGYARPRPRRPQAPPKPRQLPILLPTLKASVSWSESGDICAAFGTVDTFNLLAEDEELLLLV